MSGEERASRRRRVEDIVLAALALAEGERQAHLEAACGDDGELRREVDSLLAHADRANSFLETPALETAARALAADRSMDLPGRTVGPYRIEALIGAGGMGEVYRGVDTRLRRTVALKFLARQFATDRAAVKRFEREARAASALSHPNICTVYDVGDLDGRPFIAMEFLEGQTLRVSLGGAGLPRQGALEYAIQMAHGLAAAHERGVVHRDLKPENLWVTHENRIKILDFGLAKFAEPLPSQEASGISMASEQGHMMGTVGYMSPEQVRGQPLDRRSDIFSFGSILYEMLAGKRAFQGQSPIDTTIAILQTDPPPLADAGLDRLVGRCLRKDPDDRFPSARELAEELERALAGRGWRGPVWSRRRVAIAGASAASLAGVALLAKALPGKWRFGAPRITRLAVLPLANLSGDPQQEVFADGMTDLLIADLGQIASLRVISRPSVMPFKGSKLPLREIARQVGVEAVVVGSVQSSGNEVRIAAQLLNPANDQQMWSGAYNRELTDVLALQNEVARIIAGEIRAQITPAEADRLSRHRRIVPAALGAYNMGRYFWDQFTTDSLFKAIDSYQQAIDADPDYAAAYAGIAEAWGGILFTDARPWKEAIDEARAAATKALALDDTLAEAHQAMASVYYHDWNWKGVESEVKKAIALNIGFSISHVQYSNMLRHLGRADESIAEARLALEVDPLSMLTNQMLGNAYASARRYPQAIAQYQRGLELHPNDSSLQFFLGWAYVYSGSLEKGMESLRASLATDGVDPRLSPDMAFIHAMQDKKDETRQTLKRLLALVAKDIPVSPGMIALVYVALDERQHALDWLEKAYQQHSSIMTWLRTDPRFDSIRSEPQFQDLMRRVHLI